MDKVLLVVDDEENIIRALKRLLRSDGYTIHTANSGQAGLECLKQHDIQVILSDMRMPEMNGAEFLSKVKESYPTTVRMMLSGYTDLSSVTDAINQGAIYKFLTKPWDDMELKANVNDAFRHYAEKNQRRCDYDTGERRPCTPPEPESTGNPAAARAPLAMFDLLPVGVVAATAGGEIRYVNRNAAALLPGHAAGTNLPDELRAHIQRTKNGTVTLADGTAVHVAVSQTDAERLAAGADLIITLSKAAD